MATWHKALLKYALSYTELLDEKAIDVNNLDLRFGRQSILELRDVGLNIARISKLAQLPPSLRVETARIASLKLTVPGDFIFRSSIEVDVDGIEVHAVLDEEDEDHTSKTRSRPVSPISLRSPQHRKVPRRLHSPAAYDPGGAHVPSAPEIAASFLHEQSVHDRKEIESSLAADRKEIDESMFSDSSHDDVGTGTTMGITAYLATYLEGIMDRMQVRIKNVVLSLETNLPVEGQTVVPVTLCLKVSGGEFETRGAGIKDGDHAGDRQITIRGISVHLISDSAVFSSFSSMPSSSSPAQSKAAGRSAFPGDQNSMSFESQPPERPIGSSSSSPPGEGVLHQQQAIPRVLPIITTIDYATASNDYAIDSRALPPQRFALDYDIRPGDDNISWGSRRSKSSVADEELWKSIQDDDELPESLILERSASRERSAPSEPTLPLRQRRSVSPYDHNIRNSASWPRPDDNSNHRLLQKSPGSWPTMDQSQHMIYQPLTSGFESEDDSPTDNKKAALEATASGGLPHQVDSQVIECSTEDLTQSRLFDHDEAESIYMSAIAENGMLTMTQPGAWTSSSLPNQASLPSQASLPIDVQTYEPRDVKTDIGTTDSKPLESAKHASPSGNTTPRATSPQLSISPQSVAKSGHQIVLIDHVMIWVSKTLDESQQQQSQEPQFGARSSNRHDQSSMPGTFSVYADLAASRRQGTASAYEESKSIIHSSPANQKSELRAKALTLDIGSICFEVDIPCCRLMHKIIQQHTASLSQTDPRKPSHDDKAVPESLNFMPALSVSVKRLQLSLHDRMRQTRNISSRPGILLMTCERSIFNTGIGEKSLRLGHLSLGLNGHPLLHFDRDSNIRSSTILTEDSPDIKLTIAEKFQVGGRPVVRVSVETLPLALNLDLQVIDDVLDTFGGLSGILELGSSIMSDTAEPSSPQLNRAAKGVHFQDSPRVDTGSELKLDCRIGGTDVALRGASCTLRLRTTSIKTLYREAGLVATVDHIVASGPHINGGDHTATSISVDVSNVRLEHLPSPQNRDLETLLALLTPSKDKYDNDDDILIDTLLRQRKKGVVARASVGDIRVKLTDFDCMVPLTALGSELSQLSAVAKYLPEDDRPGPLTLLLINNTELQLPVNERFGFLRIRFQDTQMAHVGLPALFASSIGIVTASTVGGADILHPLIPLVGADHLPMVMARMLGNEVDSKVKIKLFNICLEYSVSVVLALTGMGEEAEPEELLKGIAASVVSLAHVSGTHTGRSVPKSAGGSPSKKTRIILLVHDSAIGLTPAKLSSKALFILTDAQCSTLIPPEEGLDVQLELKKAAIFITNQVDQDRPQAGRGSLNNTAVNARLATDLSRQGYSSVGSIGKAKISVQVLQDLGDASTSCEVEFSNDFLLLETCADSTQTLIATLGGLVPPTPPSKQPKYKTEAGITIEEMMSSFTGEPVVKSQTTFETMFDVDEEPADDPDSLLLEPTFDAEQDDFMADSEMTSSLYGPLSGQFEYDDQDNDFPKDAKEEDYRDIAESLLEDDPFEMPSSPVDMRMEDGALLRDLKKQCRNPVSDDFVDLGLYEIEDLGYDALGAAGQPLGSRYRFNTPAVGKRSLTHRTDKQRFPFKLRLREVNAIWNIYDGFDWQRTRERITNAVEEVEVKAEERKARNRQSRDARDEDEPVIGDLLFNSFYIGVPSGNDAQELRRQINRGIDDQVSETELSAISRPTTYSASGRAVRQRTQRRLKLERSKHHKIGFELKGVCADVLVFPPDSKDIVSSVDVRIRDFEIFDQVPTSTWSKFLTHLQSDPAEREMAKPMFHIELLNVRTVEEHSAAELLLHVAVTPLRLHVDHDALDFITRFFEFKDDSIVDASDTGEQPFLQRVEIETVDLQLDYKPKRIDYAGLRSGHTAEFINFITLDAANIQLRHAIVYGLRGFDPLHKTLNDIWMPDVTKNQLPTVLAGLAPVRGLVNIGVSAKEVIAIPIREYQKDGRIVRSIQKGAYHFGKTTTSELARFGAKVAIGTQNALQNVEEFLSPAAASSSARPSLGRSPSSDQGWHDDDDDQEEHEPRAISSYANQPLGALPGLAAARRYLEHDLLTARDAFIAVQGAVLESSTPGGVVAAVARHAPVVMLRPLIGATRAVGTTLLGVGNQIDRDNVRRMADVSLCGSLLRWSALAYSPRRSTRVVDPLGWVWPPFFLEGVADGCGHYAHRTTGVVRVSCGTTPTRSRHPDCFSSGKQMRNVF